MSAHTLGLIFLALSVIFFILTAFNRKNKAWRNCGIVFLIVGLYLHFWLK